VTIRLHPEESLPDDRGQTRRQFCAYSCQAATLLAVGALAGCGGGPTAPSPVSNAQQLPSLSGTVNGRNVTLTVDGSSPVASVGGVASVQSSLGQFLIARVSSDAFIALTSMCTHDACTITGHSGSDFVCPCHGSTFTNTGAVINGPATRALPQFPTTFDGTVLTVTV
jgi:cytochrome b6-f complex iron-sulfur subunit